jgi:phosphoglycolate phosphatase
MSVVVGFDLDGTLVDSVDDIAAALNLALAESGRATLPVARVRGFVGRGARNLVVQAVAATSTSGTLGEADGDGVVDDVLARFRAHYARDLAVHTRAFAGVLGSLDALRAAGVVVGVATNKPGVFARPLVDRVLPGRASAVLGPDDVGGTLKPDPAILAALAAACGADTLAAYVGDSAVDVECARAAGVPVVGVTWGLRPDEVRAADVVVDAPADLAAALLQLLSRAQAAHRRDRP